MRVSCIFSEGLKQQLDGMAIGDEFQLTCTARVTGAEEVIVDVRQMGEEDARYITGDLNVTLLLSHPKIAMRT